MKLRFIGAQYVAALLLALAVHFALARALIPDFTVTVFIRFLLAAGGFSVLSRYSRSLPLALFAVFLIPVAALVSNLDLFWISRFAVIAGVLLWISVAEDLSALRQSRIVYYCTLAVWGFVLCSAIVDPQSSISGWYSTRFHSDWVPFVSDDGQNYIELGQNLFKLIGTMYRPPGYPVLVQAALCLFGPNIHVLFIANVLCLLASTALIVDFASRFTSWRFIRLLLLVLVTFYLLDDRLQGYRSVVTDPLNDLLMIGHLIALYGFVKERDRHHLRLMWALLLGAFLLRPTILYYSLGLAFLLCISSTMLTVGTERIPAGGRRAPYQRSTSWMDILKQYALWILLPVALMVAKNRIVHGTFAYSSMQSQVFAYRTYGTMLTLEKGLGDFQKSMPMVAAELETWRAQHGADQSRLSSEGKMAVFDKAFAMEKFRAQPALFARAWFAGLQSLLLKSPIDLILVLLAIGCAWGRLEFGFILLWPLYLIPIYAFEGLGTEYRFTLQIVLPCFLIVFSRLAQFTSRLSEGTDPRIKFRALAAPVRRYAPYVLVVLIGVIGFSTRKNKVVGLEVPLPHQDIRQQRLGGDLSLNPADVRKWRVTLNLIPLGTLTRMIAPGNGFVHQSLELKLAGWIPFTFSASSEVDFNKNSCIPVIEQLRTTTSTQISDYTTEYEGRKRRFWADTYQFLRGPQSHEESSDLQVEPPSQAVCEFLRSGAKADEYLIGTQEMHVTSRSAGAVETEMPKIPGLKVDFHFQHDGDGRWDFHDLRASWKFLKLRIE